MHATTVIKKPLLTEKATVDSEENNRYAFEVDRRATKHQIKRRLKSSTRFGSKASLPRFERARPAA